MKEEGKPRPAKIGVETLYESFISEEHLTLTPTRTLILTVTLTVTLTLTPTLTSKEEKAGSSGWWDQQPWLQGVSRALTHLDQAESNGLYTPKTAPIYGSYTDPYLTVVLPVGLSSPKEERLKLVLNMNIDTVLPGTEARRDFEKLFIQDISEALRAPAERCEMTLSYHSMQTRIRTRI